MEARAARQSATVELPRLVERDEVAREVELRSVGGNGVAREVELAGRLHLLSELDDSALVVERVELPRLAGEVELLERLASAAPGRAR